MSAADRYRLIARRRRIQRRLDAEVAQPVTDLSLVRRLLRRVSETNRALQRQAGQAA